MTLLRPRLCGVTTGCWRRLCGPPWTIQRTHERRRARWKNSRCLVTSTCPLPPARSRDNDLRPRTVVDTIAALGMWASNRQPQVFEKEINPFLRDGGTGLPSDAAAPPAKSTPAGAGGGCRPNTSKHAPAFGRAWADERASLIMDRVVTASSQWWATAATSGASASSAARKSKPTRKAALWRTYGWIATGLVCARGVAPRDGTGSR